MRIFVTEPNTFVGDDLVPGEEYEVRPTDTGTERQNRAWHALLQEYWASGCHSYDAGSFPHFRELIKLYLGVGTEKYYSLVDDNGNPVSQPTVKYRVKSWKRYDKKERRETIDNLKNEMIQAGVSSRKFEEILRGMEGGSCVGADELAMEANDDGRN